MTEAFEQVCPTYMAYGMTWEQFWYGDPYMVKTFHDAFILKQRIENQYLWLQGVYTYHAVHAVVAAALGNRNAKYVEKPFDVFPKTEAEIKHERLTAKNKLIRFLDAMLKKKKEPVNSNKGVEDHGKP